MPFIIGLDLGSVQDYSALAIIERPNSMECTGKPILKLPHLQRWRLGTPYTQIVDDVKALVHSDQIGYAPVVTDQTGVGRPVVDLLGSDPNPVYTVPVTITGGHAVTQMEDRSYHVPKKELVSTLQLVLQSRRLQIARSLPDADVLVREMQQFQVRITLSANEQFGAWREGTHDDLVLAVALACWWSDHTWFGPFECGTDRSSPLCQLPRDVFLHNDPSDPWMQ